MENKKRFFEYEFKTGFLKSGKLNLISDVKNITVGHATKIEDKNIRTGVTIIDPGIKNLYRNKIPAAFCIGNGFGKITGLAQIQELGTLEAPIALANTFAVGPVVRGVVDLVLSREKISKIKTINVLVAECNDGILNDIHKKTIFEKDVFLAFKNRTKNFETGNVGAGTGTRCFSWKGGIGSASRILSVQNRKYTVGTLIQTNYGGALEILGVPIGKILGKNDYQGIIPDTDGSCIIIIATDAPLTSRQLKRISKRALMGLAKTGTIMRHGSGDFVLTFTTSRMGLEGSGIIGKCLPDSELNGLFLAAAESTEESVYDALFSAETMKGNGNILEALPKEKVIEILKKCGK